MEDKIPDWLNKQFLESTLQNEVKGSNIVVTKYDIQPAVPVGAHFASCLLRVAVQYAYRDVNDMAITGAHHLIVKSLPTVDIMRRIIIEARIFKRETDMYLVAMPHMYRLAEDLTRSKVPYFSSRCIYSEPDILVLEDLQHLGYKMADRRNGLDLSHARLALTSLARFHAMSIAFYKKDPNSMSLFSEGFYTEGRRQILSHFFEPAINCLASVVEKWPGYERFGVKIRHIADTGVARVIEVVKPKEGSLSVLNHGDFWVNNMLFRYSSEEVEDIMFVDFQVSRFSSPALDLQYFMYTSVSEEVRCEHMNDLFEVYHTVLRKTMQVLGCGDVEFSLQQLKIEFEDRAFFGLITACTLLNLILSDPKDALSMENMEDDAFKAVEKNPLEKGYSGALYRETFQKLLLHFESKGLL